MRVFLASTLRNDATSVVRGLLIAAGNAVPLRTGTGSNLPRCDVVVALVSVQPDADRLLQVWEEAKAAQAHRVPVVGASLAAPDELPAAVAAIPHDGQWIMVDVERQDAASLIEALAAVSHAQDRARQGRVAGAPPVHKQFPEIEATTGEDGFRRGPGEDRDRRSNSTAPRSTRLSYDAFMSYSHAVDGHLAPALQAGLQSLATPWYRRRALRVFRDKTSLSASPELWPAIEQALGNSAFFILLASPEAASSRWVNEEIGWWREHRTPETLLVALTSGRLTWDGADGDFGPEAAVPSSARGWLRSEPLWVDLRWAGSDEDLSARNPRFLDAVADLAAPLRGMPKDALVGEDLRQHRRTVRLARGVAVMLVLLIVASVAAAVIAIGQRNNAIAQSKSARSRELAAKAEAQRSVDPRVSLLLAIKAVETAETQEADAALRASLVSDQVGATLTGHRGTVIDADFESSGSRVVSAGEDGTVRVWSWASGRTDSVLRGHRGRVHAVDFGPSGREIASGGVDGTVRVWFERRPGESRDELVLRGHRGAVADVAFSPDGGRLASTGADGTIRVWDWRRRRLERVLRGHRPGRLQVGFGSRRTVSSVSFSPDGRSIVTGGADNTARVWDTRTGATLAVLRSGPNEPIQVTAEFHPDGRRIISNHRDGVRIWDWRRRTSRRVGIIAGGATDLHVSADGRTFVQGSPDGTVRTFDVSTGRETRALRGHSNAVLAVEFSRDGRRIVSAGADGMVRVWNENAPVALRATRRGAVTDISFDEDGRRLATTGQDGSLRLWDWRRARMVRGVRVPGGEALSVAWDSSGRRVATGSEDGSIALWDATTARLTARWRGQQGIHSQRGVQSGRAPPGGGRAGNGYRGVVP